MKPYITYTNRSIYIEKDKFQVYYGPDETDELTGDYCMTIAKNGKQVARYTNSQLLDISNGEGLKDLVIAGLVSYLK